MFGCMPMPVLIVTEGALQIAYCNQAAVRFFGVTETELLHHPLTGFFNTEQDSYIAWEQSLQHTDIAETELEVVMPQQENRQIVLYTAHTEFAGAPHLLLGIADITKHHDRTQYLEELAAKDDLTGLLNRRSFRKRLKAVLQSSRETKSTFFLAFMDLDDLKQVNDMYGHREGDWYITTFASLLRNSMRKADIAGRVGGDEFAAIFTQCSRSYAEQTVNRIQQQISSLADSLNKPYCMGVSIGLIVIDSWLETDADTLLSIADAAMYKQKYLQLHSQSKLRCVDKNKTTR